MAAVAVRTTGGLAGALASAAGYYAASAGGDSFPAIEQGTYLVHVINANAGATVLTVDDPNTVAPDSATAFNPDVALSVAAGTAKIFNLGNVGRYRDVNGNVNIVWSVSATVTFMVYRIN